MTKCVVVASYDPEIRKHQQTLFKGFDVKVCAVGNGDDALQMASSEKPDLILIDPMLPRVSGFEVSRIIRESQPNLPIIMLTSVYKGMIYRNEAIHRYGVTEFFEEPVDAGKFRNAVQHHLGIDPENSDRKISRSASGKSPSRKSTRRRLDAILVETGTRTSRS